MSTSFNDDMIRRSELPADVMWLIHDLCYHIESRGIEGYVKRAQRILSVDGCGSLVARASSSASATSVSVEEWTAGLFNDCSFLRASGDVNWYFADNELYRLQSIATAINASLASLTDEVERQKKILEKKDA